MPFLAFFMSGIGLKILAGVALAAVAGGLVLRHDHNIRVDEAGKWKPKVAECATANTALQGEYSAFVAKHNAQVAADAARAKAMKAARDAALGELAKRDGAEQARIDAARVAAAAAPLPKEEACAQADATLRALATDLVRESQPQK